MIISLLSEEGIFKIGGGSLFASGMHAHPPVLTVGDRMA